jgi:hypothetical protein
MATLVTQDRIIIITITIDTIKIYRTINIGRRNDLALRLEPSQV